MENNIPITEESMKKYPQFKKQLGYYTFIGGEEGRPKNALSIAHNDLEDWYCYFRNFGYLMEEFGSIVRQPDDLVLLRNDLKYTHELENLYFAITGNHLEKI